MGVMCAHRNKNLAKPIAQQIPNSRNRQETVWPLSGYSWIIIVMAVLLLVTLWSFISFQINTEYNSALAGAKQETMNLAIAFEEHVRRIIADADMDLINLKYAYEQDGLSSRFFDTALHTAADPSRSLIAIYNEQGIVVASYIQDVEGAIYSDRDYFLSQRDSASHDLAIGRTILARNTPEAVIPLTRRIEKPDGSFGGIGYISLRTNYFLSFYKTIDLGENQQVSLIGLDGFVRARQSAGNFQNDQDLRNTFIWDIMQSGQNNGSYLALSPYDTISRVYSYRIMPEYPLLVTVGKATEAAFANYYQRKQRYLLGASMVSAVIIAFCILLIRRHEQAKKLTMEIQQERDWLASLINSINDEVWFVDTSGQVTLANPTANLSFRLADETDITKILDKLEVLRPDGNPRPIAESPPMRALQGEAVNGEQEIVRVPIEGTLRYREVSSNPVRDTSGTIIGAISIVRDITEHKAMEDEIRKHRDHLQVLVEEQLHRINEINAEIAAIFESISEPFWVLDKEWRLTYINKAAIQLVDKRLSQQDIGQDVRQVFPELVGGELFQYCDQAKQSTDPVHAIYQSTTSKKYFETHLYPYGNGLLVHLRDITGQKADEAELARLERLNLIGEMAASIGHEVRNPMTTVRGYLQLFGQKAAFLDYREQLVLMVDELDRANSIITEFLSLAKNKKVELKGTDLNAVIRSLLPLLQASALERGCTIELDLTNIPAVFADDREIRQCILNLVNNGIDAMPNGGKILISTAAAGTKTIMSVRDQGTGIPPEIEERLGIPFVTTKEHGTGLGLSVCYRIAQRHHAVIEIETGPEGTVFHFVFAERTIAK